MFKLLLLHSYFRCPRSDIRKSEQIEIVENTCWFFGLNIFYCEENGWEWHKMWRHPLHSFWYCANYLGDNWPWRVKVLLPGTLCPAHFCWVFFEEGTDCKLCCYGNCCHCWYMEVERGQGEGDWVTVVCLCHPSVVCTPNHIVFM